MNGWSREGEKTNGNNGTYPISTGSITTPWTTNKREIPTSTDVHRTTILFIDQKEPKKWNCSYAVSERGCRRIWKKEKYFVICLC